jgi:hypothetical protein
MRVTKKIRLEDLAVEISMIPGNFTQATDMALNLPRVVSYAKSICSVMTGALRDSIRVERPAPHTAKLMAGGVGFTNPLTGKPVDYARYVHEGTSRMPSRPFLTMALLSERLNTGREILYGASGVNL